MDKKKTAALVVISVLGVAFVALLVFILLHNQSVKRAQETEEAVAIDAGQGYAENNKPAEDDTLMPDENSPEGDLHSSDDDGPEDDILTPDEEQPANQPEDTKPEGTGEEPSPTPETAKEETDYAKVREELAAQYGYGLAEGKVLPDDVVITDMDGNAHSVTEYLGKPLYINMFTTWCGPCNSEMPDLAATAQEYAGAVNFILVDLGDSKKEIESFVKQHNLTIPMYYTDGSFGSEYIESIPRQLVLDCYGRVVSYKVGSITRADMQILCGLAIKASE